MIDHSPGTPVRLSTAPSVAAVTSVASPPALWLTLAAGSLGAAALLFGSCQATAGVVTANYRLDDGVGQAIARFDGGLGTLDSVDLVFLVHESWEARFQADPGASEVNGEVYISTIGDLALSPMGVMLTANGSRTISYSVPFRNGLARVEATWDATILQTLTDTSAFVGASPFMATFTDHSSVEAYVPTGGTITSQSDNAIANFTITYNYSPAIAAIPEPATWAVMLMGFGAAGTLLRRSRALANA